jgi:hypothetical protein
MKRSCAVRIAVSAVLLGTPALVATTAHASNDLGVRVPDGTPTYMFRNALTTRFSNAVEWVRQNQMNPTDLTTLYASSVSSTYLNIVDNDYGNTGWSGLYDCATGPNSGVCQRGDVIFNLWSGAAPGGSYDDTEARSLACEEIGHAMGLAHRYTEAGCMAQQWSRTAWTTHDRNHINAWY